LRKWRILKFKVSCESGFDQNADYFVPLVIFRDFSPLPAGSHRLAATTDRLASTPLPRTPEPFSLEGIESSRFNQPAILSRAFLTLSSFSNLKNLK